MANYKRYCDISTYQYALNLDPDEYFKRYERLLPAGLTENDTVLLHRIDNIECIFKIVEKNPKARYTVYGDKRINAVLKRLGRSELVGFVDSCRQRVDDCKTIDASRYDYVVYNRHPSSRSPTKLQTMLGIPVGAKVQIGDRQCEVLNNDTILFDGKQSKIHPAEKMYRQSVGKSTNIDPFALTFYNGVSLYELRHRYNNTLLVERNKR